MSKSKKRILQKGINNKLPNMTREHALLLVVNNINDRVAALDLITLFGFTAEEMLEAGAAYEDVVSLGALVKA